MGPLLLLAWNAAHAFDVPDVDRPLAGVSPQVGDAAVVVGNETYRSLPTVPQAHKDAEAFRDFLVHGRGIPQERAQLLEDASRAQIADALKVAAAGVRSGGTLWFYFAGHGAVDVNNNDRLWLGVDAPATPKVLAAQGLDLDLLLALRQDDGVHVMVVADASYLGKGRMGEEVFPRWRYVVPATLPSLPTNAMVWSAAGQTEFAHVHPYASHGLFTYWVLGALRGWADGVGGGPHDGEVSLEEASTYVSNLMSAVGGIPQHPTLERGGSASGWGLSTGAFEPAPTLAVFEPPVDGQATAAQVESAWVPTEMKAAMNAQDAAKGEQSKAAVRAVKAMQAQASGEWQSTASAAVKGGAAASMALRAYIAKYSAATVTVEGKVVAVPVPEVALAQEALARLGG